MSYDGFSKSTKYWKRVRCNLPLFPTCSYTRLRKIEIIAFSGYFVRYVRIILRHWWRKRLHEDEITGGSRAIVILWNGAGQECHEYETIKITVFSIFTIELLLECGRYSEKKKCREWRKRKKFLKFTENEMHVHERVFCVLCLPPRRFLLCLSSFTFFFLCVTCLYVFRSCSLCLRLCSHFDDDFQLTERFLIYNSSVFCGRGSGAKRFGI